MSNVIIYGDIPDKLRTEGILYKGYGVLPKYVMLDTELTIEAKTIYAYFCSFAGSGETAFPNRDKILAELPMSKDAYYKHFKLLVENGYIEITQQKNENNVFGNNIYTLMSNPKKFEEAPADKKHNQAYMRIRFGGLKAAGYGMIPKAVMIDNRLHLKSKGIYAYFCSFTGSGNAAFPKKEAILHHLQITEKTYYKFYKELVTLNYITAVQRHIDGRMSVNDYFLNDTPDDTKTVSRAVSVAINQDSKKQDTAKQDTQLQDSKKQDTAKQDTQLQDSKKQDTAKQDTQLQDSKKQDTLKQDTNINRTNINNPNINNIFNINQSINQQGVAKPLKPAKPELIDRLNDEEYKEEILEELLEAKTIPYEFMGDDVKLTIAIKILSEWEHHSNPKNYCNGFGGIEQSAFITFVEALIEMLTYTNKPMTLKGSIVTYAKVYDRLQQYIQISSYNGMMYFSDFQETAIQDFITACKNYEIKNHMQYMKACIWNALQTASVGVAAQVAHDFPY